MVEKQREAHEPKIQLLSSFGDELCLNVGGVELWIDRFSARNSPDV